MPNNPSLPAGARRQDIDDDLPRPAEGDMRFLRNDGSGWLLQRPESMRGPRQYFIRGD